MGPTRDAALGCVLGAAVGDSLGSYLEFSRIVTPEKLEKALEMPGGGPLGVMPGQVTDDTELALAMARVLADRTPGEGFPSEEVLSAYREWLESDPFDVGMTCRSAFAATPFLRKYSQSNGALMRIAPLCVWAAGSDDGEVAALARADAALSHCDPAVGQVSGAFAVCAARLLCGASPETALRAAEAWLESEQATAVLEWMGSDWGEMPRDDATQNQGWVRHGFRLAVHHLRRGTSFRDAMRHVLGLGGDTDTNCAIVGALLGARWGTPGIPAQWIDRVLGARVWEGRQRRPPEYHPKRFLELQLRRT